MLFGIPQKMKRVLLLARQTMVCFFYNHYFYDDENMFFPNQ